MSRRLLRLAAELRTLASEIETRVAAGSFTKVELGNLGAVLLNAGAVVAHECGFDRPTFSALAGVAHRNQGQRRAN